LVEDKFILIFHSSCENCISHHYSFLLRKRSLLALGKIQLLSSILRTAERRRTELHGQTPWETSLISDGLSAHLLRQQTSLFDGLKYPLILGGDIAGEVVEVVSGVTRFKKGNRALEMPLGLGLSKPSEGGFQLYSIVHAVLAASVPDSMSLYRSTVFPLCLSTAACGLFQQDHLALQQPTVPTKPTGKTIIIWCGASAVGSNGIQLAVAGGYEVFATASPKNFDYLQKIGASKFLTTTAKP